MESSILSEVDDTSILRTGLPRRYACPLNWLPASRLLPRAAGWSAATLCFGLTPSRTVIAENVRDLQSWSSHGRRRYGAGGASVSRLARLRRGALRPSSGLSILEI